MARYRKNTPWPKILEPPKNTPEIPKKIPKMGILGILGVFFRYFRGILGEILGVQNFGPGGIFSVFFVEIPGRAISGLCSRSGRSQKKGVNMKNFAGNPSQNHPPPPKRPLTPLPAKYVHGSGHGSGAGGGNINKLQIEAVKFSLRSQT